MHTSHRLTHFLLALVALVACTLTTWAQPVPDAGNKANIPSTQKPGSMLFYDIYTSTIGDSTENTRMNITNTHPTRSVNVHMFFIRKSDCTIADIFLCLTANQTYSFLASEYDPNETGFMFAVATSDAGVPLSHNYLIGDLYVKSAFKTTSYFQANLGAMAYSARKTRRGAAPAQEWVDGAEGLIWSFDPSRTGLSFGDYQSDIEENLYDAVPNRLAVDNIQSIANGNETLVILHSMQGKVDQAGAIGMLSGQVYNDVEKGFSYQIRGLNCLETRLLNDALIRIPFGYSKVIPSSKTGWMYFQSPLNPAGVPNLGLQGATIVSNTKVATDKAAFNGGHHLHILSVKENPGFAIPIFPTAACVNY